MPHAGKSWNMGARHEKWGCPVGLSPLLGVQLGLSIGITWYNDYDGNHPLSWDKPPFSITTDQLITGTAPPTKGRKRLRRPAKLCSASCESFPQPAGFGSKSTAIPTTLGMLQHGAGGPMNQMWISKWFQPWDHFIHSGWITTTKPCCHWGNIPKCPYFSG